MIFISRLLFPTVFVTIGVCYSPIASAETLSEAIQTLLNSYPGLKSQEQFLSASREALPQARSVRRPNISANVTALLSESNLLHDNLNSFPGSRTFGGSINLSQELYRGGRTRAGIGRAKANIQASEFSYKSFKQNLIVDAIRAYVNVLLQQEILNIYPVSLLTRILS